MLFYSSIIPGLAGVVYVRRDVKDSGSSNLMGELIVRKKTEIIIRIL